MLSEKKLAKHWWAILIRGIIALVFALLAFCATGFTLELLLIFLGVYFILDGLFSVIGSFMAMEKHRNWWMLMFEGVFSLLAGMFVFVLPDVSLLIMLYIVAFWAILTGIFELLASLSASWATPGKVLFGIVGVFSIIMGVLVFLYPNFSINVAIWLLGIYALVIGLSLIFFGLRLRASLE